MAMYKILSVLVLILITCSLQTVSAQTFVEEWGSSGYYDGEFATPVAIAIDSNGYVYVLEFNNHRLQKFDSDGNFITKWGSYGSEEGEFNNPRGVAIDPLGYVYVADLFNDRIQKFKSSILETAETREFVLSSSIDGKTFTITGKAAKAMILGFTIKPNESVHFDLSGAGGEVELTIPREIIDEIHTVVVGERQIPFQQTHYNTSSTTIHLRIPENADSLEIIGAKVIPEFPLNLMMVMAIALTGLMVLFRSKRINLYI